MKLVEYKNLLAFGLPKKAQFFVFEYGSMNFTMQSKEDFGIIKKCIPKLFIPPPNLKRRYVDPNCNKLIKLKAHLEYHLSARYKDFPKNIEEY